MEDELFRSLTQSLKEAAAISKGQGTPSRITTLVPGSPAKVVENKCIKAIATTPTTENVRSTLTIIDARAVREKSGLSQSEFAIVMNVSVKTLQNWEQQKREPTGPALALLRIVAHEPEIALRALRR